MRCYYPDVIREVSKTWEIEKYYTNVMRLERRLRITTYDNVYDCGARGL